MKTSMTKASRDNLKTIALLVLAFAVVQALRAGGVVNAHMDGMLVPLCVYATMAVSLNLVVGILGELSLGHAGFMCVGAFSSAFFSKIFEQSMGTFPRFLLAILIGGIVAGIFGFLIGIPVLRLNGREVSGGLKQLAAGDTTTVQMTSVIDRPQLWSAETPHLYPFTLELRDADGTVVKDFVLNNPTYSGCILVAGKNFGSGSSREHAAWAIAGYGFRVVISSFFADIHKNNELNNFVLPVQVSEDFLKELFDSISQDPKTEVEVDLPRQTVTNKATGRSEHFDINGYKKHCLMNGLDDIDFLMQNQEKTKEWEHGTEVY